MAPRPYLGPSIPFGKIFTEHFVVVDWNSDTGWGAPRIRPVAPFSLHPAAQTLQYGMHCFEGMKAYRSNASDTPHLFRPLLNMERFRRSAERLHLPTFSAHELLTCIKVLVNIEQAWVPKEPDCSLYLRPTLMASTPFLGVGPADECILYVIASPCGPFLPPDWTGPVRMFLEEARARHQTRTTAWVAQPSPASSPLRTLPALAPLLRLTRGSARRLSRRASCVRRPAGWENSRSGATTRPRSPRRWRRARRTAARRREHAHETLTVGCLVDCQFW